MSRRERRSAFGLLARQSATDAPLAAIVAIVVAVCAFLVIERSRSARQVSDRELRHTLRDSRHLAMTSARQRCSAIRARLLQRDLRPQQRHRGDHGRPWRASLYSA